MAKWGLTAEMLEQEVLPWGLSRDLLAPSKTQTDPVHQNIYWNELERQIIDSRPMQRLRSVKQLGTTLKVYPLCGTLAFHPRTRDLARRAGHPGPH